MTVVMITSATAIVKVTMDIASKVHVARYVKLFMMMMLILKNVPTHVLKPAIYSSSISKKRGIFNSPFLAQKIRPGGIGVA